MKALDLLNEVVSSLGFQVGPNNEIIVMLPNEEGYESNTVISSSGYPFVFPNNESLKKLVDVDSTGKINLKYLPFNPIFEDDLSYETEAFKEFLKRSQVMLTVETFELGSLLLTLAKNDKAIQSKGVRVEKYLTELGKHITTRTMKIVDDTTIKNFSSIITNGTKPENKNLLHVTVKKRGEIQGRTYPVVTSIYFPLVEEIYQQSGTEEAIINDVRLRKKDIVVFKELFKCLLPMLDDECVYRVGSDRSDFPLFSSAYRLYLDLMWKHKEIMEKLQSLKEPGFDPLSLVLTIQPEDLDQVVGNVYNEIKRIPSEKTLKGTPTQQETEEIQPVTIPTVQPKVVNQPSIPTVVPQVQPQPTMNVPYNPLMPQPNMMHPGWVDNTTYMNSNVSNMLDQVNYGRMGFNPLNPYGMTGPMYPVYNQPVPDNTFDKRPLGLTGRSDF